MAEPVSRREWLKRAGLAGAAIVALPELSRVLLFRRSVPEAARVLLDPSLVDAQAGRVLSDPATLTASELATLEAFCARLIPTDENGPGAKDAHAAHYIDRALGGALAQYRDDYSVGLAAVNVYAHLKHSTAKSFVDLNAEQQDAILGEMEHDVPLGFIESSAGFFNLVRGHTLQGTFCDPIYGGNANMVGWDLIGYPGVRLSVAAGEQNMSTPPARNHKSAYDYVMFSKVGI
jgi:gluconate 2-dehydrogenase gamma chain